MPDCVQYPPGSCPGTTLARVITGPSFHKLDMAFVKRFGVGRGMNVEARMDLYNITNSNAEFRRIYISGGSFGFPTTIVPPRVIRFGAKVDW